MKNKNLLAAVQALFTPAAKNALVRASLGLSGPGGRMKYDWRPERGWRDAARHRRFKELAYRRRRNARRS